MKAVLALNKPTVLVLVHGGAMSLGQLKDSAPAILDCFYGGEMAAQAMADALFGKDASKQEARPARRARTHTHTHRPIFQQNVPADAASSKTCTVLLSRGLQSKRKASCHYVPTGVCELLSCEPYG